MNDHRYWITNPIGHRLWESRDTYGQDGIAINHPVFGEATLIVPDPPPADDWYCDLCNEPMLTRWGGEPFPVPMFSSYALCAEHYYEAQTWEQEDRSGEPIEGTVQGPWPAQFCNCQPCVSQVDRWRPQLGMAYQ